MIILSDFTDDFGNRVEYRPARWIRLTPELRAYWHRDHYNGSSRHDRDYDHVYQLWARFWTNLTSQST